MACTVIAAAVNTALGSSVAGLLVGRLQAERINRIMNNRETGRTIFGILISSIDGTILHPAHSGNPKKGDGTPARFSEPHQ
jgi:hypothetical protein